MNKAFRRNGRHGPRSVAVAVVVGVIALPAHAYIDPGSGMLLWQGLLAAVGAVLVFVRHPVDAIKRWLQRWRGK